MTHSSSVVCAAASERSFRGSLSHTMENEWKMNDFLMQQL